MPDQQPTSPARIRLTRAEQRRAIVAGLLPMPAAALLLAPFAVLGPAGAGDLVAAALVYGGLVGLATGFATAEYLHARACPRCTRRNARGTPRCHGCGYDLADRPRYACEERHRVHLDPGLCACGRRLQPLPPARGVGREVVVVLKVGGWLFAFLVAVGLLLRYLSR